MRWMERAKGGGKEMRGSERARPVVILIAARIIDYIRLASGRIIYLATRERYRWATGSEGKRTRARARARRRVIN